MTAAERTEAFLAGKPLDCPRCGGETEQFGGIIRCVACDLAISKRLACGAGMPGDDTAAIHLLPDEPVDGSKLVDGSEAWP